LSVDGDDKGTLKSDQLKKVDVKLGEHLVEADSLEGGFHWEKTVTLKEAGQIIVKTDLLGVKQAAEDAKIRQAAQEQEAIRQRAAQEQEAARLKAFQEQEAARQKALLEQKAALQLKREAELAALLRVDPSSGLMWAPADNGYDVTVKQAMSFCADLRLGGFRDWRLPTIEELQRIYDPSATPGSDHVKGKIELTGVPWSSTPAREPGFTVFLYFGDNAGFTSHPSGDSTRFRALCVRRP
jgi:hypothetical protein